MFRQTAASPETHCVGSTSSRLWRLIKEGEQDSMASQMASPVEARTQIWDNRNNLSLTRCSKSQTCMFFDFAIAIASVSSDDDAEYAEMID